MKKQRGKIIIYLFVFLVFVSACSGKGSEDSEGSGDKSGTELVLAIGGEPDAGFDPLTGWGRYGSPLFQSTLLKQDKNFDIETDLATEYDVSEDGIFWTVLLRSDAKFSDGEPVTAADVIFTFETAKSKGSIVDLTMLEKVEQTDSNEVRFTLKHPHSTFIYVLTSLGIVPKHAYGDDYNKQPIGSGPYQLEQWNKGQQLIVTENPYYYGKKPYFTKLTFLFLNEDSAFAAAKANQVDVVSVPATLAQESIAGMNRIELESVDNRGIMFPFIPAGKKTTKDGYPIGNDVTADIAIRKAINIAIDRQALVDDLLNGFGTPAYSIADQLPWWNPETVIADGDLETAKQILDEANWSKGGDGIRKKDGMRAQFTLYYPAGDQIRQSLSMVVRDELLPLGIDVTTEGKSWNELERLMYANPVLMGWGSLDPTELHLVYSSHTQGEGFYNPNYYGNPVVDKYMEKAMQATTAEEANEYWQLAQWDNTTGFSAKGDAPWAWLVNLQHIYFIDKRLEIGEQKIQPHGHGWPITEFITEWQWTEVE